MKVVLGRFGGQAEKISLKLGEIQVLAFILCFWFSSFSFEYYIPLQKTSLKLGDLQVLSLIFYSFWFSPFSFEYCIPLQKKYL